jgi:hypothetical protein
VILELSANLDSIDLTPIFRRQVETKRLLNVKIIPVEPIFTFCIAFSTVNMNRFISFICIEEKSPSHYKQYGWHMLPQQ